MASKGQRFEASFTTEHTLVGLNTAFGVVSQIVDREVTLEDSQETTNTFGIPEAIVSPWLQFQTLLAFM
ncbi:hypothetical protein ERO13_D02G094850v2 [Gossypium hirsutum]|uniref:Uncharacterized protein n=2 Tax=Gossypium TaxID=3633 RepID=A0A5D2VUR4_GOSMU|nr:hypothetical protein ES319_D02G108900v1 [Gossypium barbadense]KAG4157988.1 hypothetical protein ERO13_D02G094850v2 [Gossypium hirsutum]TYI93086.1 hypothetical protein E1A91_D02G114300v1 [Gossypium mustelinum]TYI93087.1 hypothetical protein E1A91_D02G114300v1 [Gossypium mustelinum]